GFGTNGDDVAKSRFAIAQQAIAPTTVSAPNGGFNDQQFLAAVASGNAPDLVYMDRAKVGTYAADGALQPLTSCVSSQQINLIQAQGGYNSFLSFRNTWDFFGSGNQVAKDQVGAWPMEDWYVNVLAGASPQVHTLLIPVRTLTGHVINYTSGSAWAIPKGSKD